VDRPRVERPPRTDEGGRGRAHDEDRDPQQSQRRELTRSFKITLARMVSNTRLAADAGTAKLRSATPTSVIKAKKEMAMKKTARIRYFLRARVASKRPMPVGRKS